MSGVREGLPLPPPSDFDGADAGESRLPQSLGDALEAAGQSEFIHSVLPEKYLSQYLMQKEKEFEDYRAAKNPYQYEIERYFDRI